MFTKIVLAVLTALVLAGCGSAQTRIDSNNEFAAAKVNGRCDALKTNPEYYEQCLGENSRAFLDCYSKKLGAAIMPLEAWPICRLAVDSRGKKEPGVSTNPADSNQRFGVDQGYGYTGNGGNYSYGNRGYNHNGGGYNGGYGYGNLGYGYSGGYVGDWPRLPNEAHRIQGIQIIQGPPQVYTPPVQIQTGPTYIAPIPGQPQYNYRNGPP